MIKRDRRSEDYRRAWKREELPTLVELVIFALVCLGIALLIKWSW